MVTFAITSFLLEFNLPPLGNNKHSAVLYLFVFSTALYTSLAKVRSSDNQTLFLRITTSFPLTLILSSSFNLCPLISHGFRFAFLQPKSVSGCPLLHQPNYPFLFPQFLFPYHESEIVRLTSFQVPNPQYSIIHDVPQQRHEYRSLWNAQALPHPVSTMDNPSCWTNIFLCHIHSSSDLPNNHPPLGVFHV